MKKNIEDFIPSEGKDPNTHPKLRTWEKTVVWIACLSLVIMPVLFGWLGFVLSLVASGSVFVFIIGGFGLKKMSHNPNDAYSKLGSLSLILSLFKPLKVFLFLICASLLAIWFVGKPYWKIQEQNWKLIHPGQDLPKPKHFGFVFGETTFEEAVQILEESGAVFRISNQYVAGKKIEQIPEIIIDHYAAIEKLLPLGEGDEGASIEFDDQNKVYLLHILFNRSMNHNEAMQKMAAINTAYHQKYKPHAYSFDPRGHEYYHTPGGIGIIVNPEKRRIQIINNRKKETVQGYREKLSLGDWKDDMEAIISPD